MIDRRIHVRNIDPVTYEYLVERSQELSRDGQKVSINQVINLILNQHCRNAYFREEFTEIEKQTQRIDYLTEAINDLALTYQELLENKIY